MSLSLINSLFKYFVIQSVSRRIFLFSLIMINKVLEIYSICNIVIFFAMWLKIGFFPFRA